MADFALKLFIATLLIVSFGTKSTTSEPEREPEQVLSLAERLQSNESTKCWDSMLEIHSCLGEVVMFFLNGETYIGPSCCEAVRSVVRECRSAMLGSLGLTTEETSVLDDYCEGEEERAAMAEVVAEMTPSAKAASKPSKVVPLEDLNKN